MHLTKAFATRHCDHHLLGFNRTVSSAHNLFSSSLFSSSCCFPSPCSRKLVARAQKPHHNSGPKERLRIRGNKDNVWSVDNDLANATAEKEKARASRRKQKGRSMVKRKGGRGGRVLVSGAMLMEVETVLQTQEPVIKPVWNTFASSVSGIWKGVGAVFSPLTAEMEPVEIGNKNENLYDCYTLSRVEAVPSPSGRPTSQIQRKINWVTLNPFGETLQHTEGNDMAKEGSRDGGAPLHIKEKITDNATSTVLPTFESFNFERSDVMEEDVMECEPGLIYFEVSCPSYVLA
ncbi:uncharacterized protein LOC129301022 [Prosopis cineraria]|uniref:uncharacterized protein LOC129301022 n=1 Tax=Prosopis cineraria TaxID=364024 RepID=UPI00240EE987|nr:uncharacterized protein LOC129301022 [Prosopis cineraria]